jgi:RNA-directed DNA polymerase
MDIKQYKILITKYKSKDLNAFFNEIAAESLIDYILSRKDSFYKSFKIKKKNGSYRNINEPLNQLFSIQKEFSLFFLVNRTKYDHSHGFELNKSIVTNAREHVNKKIVLNIDLENFFTNISSPRIIEFLIKKFNVSEIEAIKIADILTYKNSLPQGSPSSPVISNFICEKLDFELYKYCRRFNITYTRYADDLSFSFSFDKLPKFQVNNIISIIEQNGFKINKAKYRYYYRNTRQIVTGLVVNEKVNVKREFYKNLRAILYNWSSKGIEVAQNKFIEKHGENKNFILTVAGWINFLGQVQGEKSKKFISLKSQFKKLEEETRYTRTFNFDSSIPINLSELKTVLGISTINLHILQDSNGVETNFMRHWDAKRRIAILFKKDLVINLKDNSDLSILVEESIKDGKDGKYLMLLVKEYNLLL